jgi:hypothetical protein
MNAAPHDPALKASGKEPMRTPNKNRTGHKEEHGQVNHQKHTLEEIISNG